MDDNFSSIVNAVLWGRCVFDNIRNFLQFQLTVNMVALLTALIAAVSNRGLPLKTVQLLWVNLIMDTLAALALGTETPTKDLLDRKPYGLNEPLISRVMMRNILLHALWQIGILLGILYGGPVLFNLPYTPSDDPEKQDDNKLVLDTIIFNSFVFLQLFNEFNSRIVTSNKHNPFYGIYKNYTFGIIFIITVALQALLIEFGGQFMETKPLDLKYWLICVGIGMTSLVVGVLFRFIPVEKWFPPKDKNNSVTSEKTERTPLLSSP